MTKTYTSPWQVLIRTSGDRTGMCDVILSSDTPLDATKAWYKAKAEYVARNGGNWF